MVSRDTGDVPNLMLPPHVTPAAIMGQAGPNKEPGSQAWCALCELAEQRQVPRLIWTALIVEKGS